MDKSRGSSYTTADEADQETTRRRNQSSVPKTTSPCNEPPKVSDLTYGDSRTPSPWLKSFEISATSLSTQGAARTAQRISAHKQQQDAHPGDDLVEHGFKFATFSDTFNSIRYGQADDLATHLKDESHAWQDDLGRARKLSQWDIYEELADSPSKPEASQFARQYSRKVDYSIPTLSPQASQRSYGNTILYDQSAAQFGDRYETSNFYSTRVVCVTSEQQPASGLTALATNLGIGFAGGLGAGVGFGAYNSWSNSDGHSCPRPPDRPKEASEPVHEPPPLNPPHEVCHIPLTTRMLAMSEAQQSSNEMTGIGGIFEPRELNHVYRPHLPPILKAPPQPFYGETFLGIRNGVDLHIPCRSHVNMGGSNYYGADAVQEPHVKNKHKHKRGASAELEGPPELKKPRSGQADP